LPSGSLQRCHIRGVELFLLVDILQTVQNFCNDDEQVAGQDGFVLRVRQCDLVVADALNVLTDDAQQAANNYEEGRPVASGKRVVQKHGTEDARENQSRAPYHLESEGVTQVKSGEQQNRGYRIQHRGKRVKTTGFWNPCSFPSLPITCC